MAIILFDYGGVLGDHHISDGEDELVALLGVDALQVRTLLSEKTDQGRMVREGRLSEYGFWSMVARLAGMRSLPAPPHILTNAWCRTYKPNEALFALLSDLRKIATIGVVTNIDPWRSQYLVNEIGILERVDLYLPSFELRSTKQSREFWVQVAGRIRIRFEDDRVMYVDDRREHVESALGVDFSGHLYDGSMERLADVLAVWATSRLDER